MKTLKKFTFTAPVGRESAYDWDKMLDGGIYQLEEGTDYTCKPATFATLLRSAARKRSKTVQTNTTDTGLVIQASDASKEQKAAWAKVDAEKKAAKAAAKLAGNGEAEESENAGDSE